MTACGPRAHVRLQVALILELLDDGITGSNVNDKVYAIYHIVQMTKQCANFTETLRIRTKMISQLNGIQ